MTGPTQQHRADALSKERIVGAAATILDAEGERALTFRALTAALNTGTGAIYWHVANKDELLAATTNAVIAEVMADAPAGGQPQDTIRGIALGLFDAIDEHPWVGAQLAREPWQLAMLQIFEGLGGRLAELGVSTDDEFDCASALLNYVLGVAGQNAANARRVAPGTDRRAFLADVAAQWTDRDPAAFPFAHRVADRLREHDDRDQFLAGIDLILAGITARTRDGRSAGAGRE